VKIWIAWLAACAAAATAWPATPQHPLVELTTSRGAFVVELYPERAPLTVASFMRNVEDRFYDGTLFHRILKDMLIQAGGFQSGMLEKTAPESIPNEAKSCMPNTRGTIALAHAADAASSGSQFFINLADNHGLDFDATAAAGFGYCAFGRVVRGMRTIQAIAQTPIVAGGDFMGDVPTEEITIQSARVLPAAAAPSGGEHGEAAYELGDDHLGP
jgi:cyclophilin family peptidyl-prolyl cis-trans isomerase